MNKKFKYKKSLLAAILSATLLAGCDGGGSGSSSDTPPVDSGTGSLPEVKPDPTPNPEPTPEPTPDPEPTPEPTPDPEPTPEPEPEPVPTKTGYLTLGGSLRVTGDITCNDESSDGFTFTPGDKVTCVAGNNTTIATFDTQSEAARSLRAVEKVSFSLEDAQELAGSDNKKSNALSLVTSMNSCPANTEQVCLEFSSVIESKRFDSLYKQIDLAPEEFKKLVNEEVENNAATDKAPSTHTSPVSWVISDSASAHSVVIKRIAERGENIQVWIDPVVFNDLLNWLNALDEKYALRVTQIDASAAEKTGMVNVQRLEFGRG
ncbi:hypothetical protein BBJ25_19780 [Escherichia coli]|nr:type II secretion system protein GspM [Escherichia coli]EEV6986622.1 hypothetical protein [Escherichia coli]EFD1090548.1 hypothetical protein [Escherichia coli]EFG2524435.1 hypothetical protein [Escherichia coli]EFT2691793.1 hypothetical protein [Escherichia coli]EHH7721155.1 hypothetical protein [Escherichia coli]